MFDFTMGRESEDAQNRLAAYDFHRDPKLDK